MIDPTEENDNIENGAQLVVFMIGCFAGFSVGVVVMLMILT